MSDLSEQMQSAMKSIDARTGESEEFVEIGTSKVLTELPSFDEFKAHYMKSGIVSLRRTYRKAAGVPYNSNEQTFDRIFELCKGEFLKLMVDAISDGYVLGRNELPVIKKFAFFDKEGVFKSDSFRTASMVQAVKFKDDYDAMEYLENYMKSAIRFMAETSGYLQDKHPAHKIWDLWGMAATSIVIGSYATGCTMGSADADQNVLNGILAVSTEDKDCDGE